MCGGCCRGLDEGEVYIYRDDVINLAKFLDYKGKAGLKKFCQKFVKIIDEKFYWKEPGADRGKTYKYKTLAFRFSGKDGHCYFLEDNKCTVHKARAFQCRSFPIGWNMLINSLKNFKDYSKKCRALQMSLENQGKFYSKAEILRWARKEYELEKDFFLEMKKNNFDIFRVYKFLPKDITC